jgi:hypothetical protein
MHASIIGLKPSQAREFCTRLWLELTIAGRSIWSDEDITRDAQLNSLKWLNEIQHRVWGTYVSAHPSTVQLLDQILAYSTQAPELQTHLRVALDRAMLAATGGEGAPTGPAP